MLKIKNFAIGVSIGFSVVSALSASNQYSTQNQNGQWRQQDQRVSSQQRVQEKNYPVPERYNRAQPFSYDMSNVRGQRQEQRQDRTDFQPSQNDQRAHMQRTQCPTLTRPEFTDLLTKGTVSKDGMTLRKASSNTGGTRKKLQGFFRMKQENSYPGTYISQNQFSQVVNRRSIKIDSMAMSSGGLEYLNRGFCLYTHKPSGKPEDLLAAIIQGVPSGSQRNKQTDERFLQQERPSQMNPDSQGQGETDDRRLIRNLAGKTVGYYREGDKPRFWKSLTRDEKSLVNDLKAKSDNGEYLNPEEKKVYNDVERILNSPDKNLQQRPMPRRNNNQR